MADNAIKNIDADMKGLVNLLAFNLEKKPKKPSKFDLIRQYVDVLSIPDFGLFSLSSALMALIEGLLAHQPKPRIHGGQYEGKSNASSIS